MIHNDTPLPTYNNNLNHRKPDFIQLGSYFNNKTGMMVTTLVLNYEKQSLSLLISISPSKNKNSKPGDKNVYDYQEKVTFSLSEAEISELARELSRNIDKDEFEISIKNHYNSDKTKVSHLNINKSSGYRNVMFSIYSNKKVEKGQTISCAVSYSETLHFIDTLRSILYNLAYYKFMMNKKKGGR